MAQIRIKNLTQHRIYVPVPVGIMMRPAQEVTLSEVSDDLLAQSKKISNLVDRRAIQIWIQPQDPEINDTLETRFINVGGGLPLHGATHYDGGSDPIDIDQLRTSGGIPGYLMVAGPGGSISWQPHTVPAHRANHYFGGPDVLDVAELGSVTAPAAGYLPASDGANGLAWVSPSAPGAHSATHSATGSDTIDVADLGSASAAGADQLVRSDGAGGLGWTGPGTPGTIAPDDTAQGGAATTYSRSDHQHAIVADTPGAVTPGDTAAEGAGTAFARADHRHSVAAFAAPGAIQPDDTADAGTSNNFARADHRHSIVADTPGAVTPDDTAAEGTATSFARSDHTHAIVADTPGAVTPGDTAAEGASTSFARADHQHSVAAFAVPGTIQPDDTADAGAATTFARSDHTHGIVAAAPAQGVGAGNAEGSATSFSRSDHDHTVRETGGPQDLTVAAIPDGYSVRRSGTTLAGVNPYDPARVVVLATNIIGADATSMADAITAANALTPTAANPVTIQIAPGTYSTPPFTLPANVNLCSIGGPDAAILSASTTTAALMSAPGPSTICGVTLKGADGVGGIGVSVTGTGGVALEGCVVDDCETGVSVAGAGYNIQFLHTEISNATDCLYVNNASSIVQVTNLTCASSTNGIHIGSAGGIVTGSQYRALESVSTRHVWVEGTTAATVFTVGSSLFREDRAFYHPNASIFVEHGSNIPGDAAVQITAELHVGSEDRPREAAFGGGDSHTRNVAYLTNTNLEAGTWANITSQLKDQDGTSVALFPGTGIANAFYVGADHQFPGLKTRTTTARAGGTLVLEYWNGTSWVAIPHCSCNADAPYGQYAQDVFGRVDDEQIRFGTGDISGWATKNLNGITKYWIRFRISVAVTTIPQADRIKVHVDRTEINKDGVVEYFGAAEPVRQLIWHRSLLEEMEGFAQPDADIDIAAGLSIKALNNRWQNGNKDGSTTLLQAIPGLDTSRPLIYEVGWAPETTDTGNVEVQLDVVTVNPGDVLDGTLPYTQQLSQVVTGPFATAYELQVTQFSFAVPDLTVGGSLALALYRDGGGGNLDDTFIGDAMHVYSAVYGTFWR